MLVVVYYCVFIPTSSLPVSRLSILAQDMANMQSRVDDVNKAVKQLEDSRHPRTKEVKECQTRLNKRCFLNVLFGTTRNIVNVPGSLCILMSTLSPGINNTIICLYVSLCTQRQTSSLGNILKCIMHKLNLFTCVYSKGSSSSKKMTVHYNK